MNKPVFPLQTVLTLDYNTNGEEPPYEEVVVVEVSAKGRPYCVPYDYYDPEITKLNLKRPSKKYGLELKIMHWSPPRGQWTVYGCGTTVGEGQELPLRKIKT